MNVSLRLRSIQLVLALLSAAGAASPDEPPTADEVRRDDGTIDYVATLNARASAGVTPENNAFAAIAPLIPPDDWPSQAARRDVFARLGIAGPDADASYIEDFDTYAYRRAQEAHPVEPAPAIGEPPPADQRELIWQMQQQRELAQQEPWSREAAPHVAGWLDEQEVVLKQLAEAVRRPRYWAPLTLDDPGDLLSDAWLVGLMKIRPITDAVYMRAMHRVHVGDLDGAIHDALTLKRLGRHLADASVLQVQLAGTVPASRGHDVIAELARHPALTAEQARALQAELRRLHRPFDVAGAIDTGERFMLLDLLQRPSRAKPEDDYFAALARALGRIDREAAARRANAFYDRLVEAAAAAHPEREAKLEPIQAELAANDARIPPFAPLRRGNYELDDVRAGHGGATMENVADIAIGMFAPSVRRFALSADLAEMRSRLEQVALGLAGYRAEHGDYPDSLEALVPDWLDAVPVDVFDADESAIRYRVEDERVLIYSVGPNGKDDGGTPGERPDQGDTVIELLRSAE